MQVPIKQAVKEVVDFVEAKGLVSSHRLAPRIIVACAEIRDLSALGNRSLTCNECESTRACLDPLQRRTSPAASYILLLADALSQENEGMAEDLDSIAVPNTSRFFGAFGLV